MLFAPIKFVFRIATLVIAAAVVYLVICGVQVVTASRVATSVKAARPAAAIVVVGTAIAPNDSSNDLAARLKWAAALYRAGRASKVLVETPSTAAGSGYVSAPSTLRDDGVPASAVVDVRSSSTPTELVDATALFGRGTHVIVVTDAIDALWTGGVATADGLSVEISPPPSSRKLVFSEISALWKESSGVAVGRVIGFGRASWAGG